MTSVAAAGTSIVIAPIVPAPNASRVVTISNVPAVAASTSVTLGTSATSSNTLVYSPESVAAADSVANLMTVNAKARTEAGRVDGLAAALLTRFTTYGGNYSQSVLLPRTQAQIDAVPDAALRTKVEAQPDNSISLNIATASGMKVAITLGTSQEGLAVQIDVGEGELSEDERTAIAALAKSFQDAVDGLASVPPRLSLAGLAKFDTKVLTSVSLHAAVSVDGVASQSIDFQADSRNRSVTITGPTGVAKVDVDVTKPAVFGNAQQQAAAISSYLQQFDSARSKGRGDEDLMEVFKAAFTDLHGSYGAAAAPSSQGTSRMLARDTYRTMLSGLADFSASISQPSTSPNPFMPKEVDGFSYQASQDTTVSGRPMLDLAVTQNQQASLDASYHTALSPGATLQLDKTEESQNYRYLQIHDRTTSKTEVAYEDGAVASAKLTQKNNLSTQVSTFVHARLVDNSVLPTVESRTRDLMPLLRAAGLDEKPIEGQRKSTEQADAILLQKHVDLARAVAAARRG